MTGSDQDRTGTAVLGPEMQLALEEAMLHTGGSGIRIRTWEFTEPVVVLGRSSQVARETSREYCDANGIGIYRRCSGGATIVGGPGCLMYTVILSKLDAPQLGMIDAAHDFVMSRVLRATKHQVPDATRQGICDLTWENRKFSGNALRITRSHVLYHGTLLYAADLELIGKCLDFAPRQPEYRQDRSHVDFLTNVPLDPATWASDFAGQFEGSQYGVTEGAFDLAEELALKRYGQADWRFRH